MFHLDGFEILVSFYILHDCISEVSDWNEIFIELHGNSKLSITSCPPSSGWRSGIIAAPNLHLEAKYIFLRAFEVKLATGTFKFRPKLA